MKTLLWLDDVRDPLTNDWLNFSPIGKDVDVHWVTNYQEFVDWIMSYGLPDAVCFDHDLNDGEIWKTYDLDNRFLLSNFGNIMKNNTKYNPFKNIGGLTFQVKINNSYKNKSVHREIAKIFIENPFTYFDEDVFVICNLPSTPRIGECLWLEDELQKELESKVKDKDLYENYLYGENISFSDCVFVKMVGYDTNIDIIKLTLGE